MTYLSGGNDWRLIDDDFHLCIVLLLTGVGPSDAAHADISDVIDVQYVDVDVDVGS
jgi:hypothetical protein